MKKIFLIFLSFCIVKTTISNIFLRDIVKNIIDVKPVYATTHKNLYKDFDTCDINDMTWMFEKPKVKFTPSIFKYELMYWIERWGPMKKILLFIFLSLWVLIGCSNIQPEYMKTTENFLIAIKDFKNIKDFTTDEITIDYNDPATQFILKNFEYSSDIIDSEVKEGKISYIITSLDNSKGCDFELITSGDSNLHNCTFKKYRISFKLEKIGDIWKIVNTEDILNSLGISQQIH